MSPIAVSGQILRIYRHALDSLGKECPNGGNAPTNSSVYGFIDDQGTTWAINSFSGWDDNSSNGWANHPSVILLPWNYMTSWVVNYTDKRKTCLDFAVYPSTHTDAQILANAAAWGLA